MLSPSLAQEIAGDTSAVIGFNVLITDAEGMVIGSGDTSRVGSFHEASVEVVRTKEPATHSTSQARQLRGVRPGVTLPLVTDGQAVGTVGITGAPARVRRFGLLVKRQTEILLRESVMLRSRLLSERAAEKLLADIASYDPQVVEGDFLVFRAAELGFDLRLRRVAVAFEVSVPGAAARRQGAPTQDMALVRSELLRTVREVFADPQDVVAGTAPGWIGVLHRLPARRAMDSLVADCRRVADVIAAQDSLSARVGIGEPADSVGGLHDSYQDACDALRLGGRPAGGSPVHLISDLRVHQVLEAVHQSARNRLLDLTTADLRAQPDWPALRETVIAWCESGFNLVRASTALHIHRNTVVYRMNKIEQITGRPLRDHRAALALYLACLADRLGGQ
ncbi:sugar diacid recognition domain-containing protein [Streptomyces sp. NL15-2K]|uniref:CdaR family transcriptional regulator n=1 Tax=Streptomyces sp. NL15-2K TaxID=376149 RepID=UPI000F57846E|nr:MULTISPECIES: sugar diacid recognition domain-containing protein [Actinomycetes]WKX15122.1 sugar diacid recognition domain-containing protein [Kutzneria buriramensis]GCB52206.1 sugar diacid utilization regulator sdaR [Streptomyces sp. NL15-2K]